MELRNCAKCSRLFAYEGEELCSRCLGPEDDQDFQKVKNYLYDHPGATIIEVSEETGVGERKILRYLRESRIEIREADNMLLDCERCGASIQTGRFCNSCTVEMQKEFSAIVKPPKKEEKIKDPGKRDTRMYIAEMRRNK